MQSLSSAGPQPEGAVWKGVLWTWFWNQPDLRERIWGQLSTVRLGSERDYHSGKERGESRNGLCPGMEAASWTSEFLDHSGRSDCMFPPTSLACGGVCRHDVQETTAGGSREEGERLTAISPAHTENSLLFFFFLVFSHESLL